MASSGEKCGKPTSDGTPCLNPVGCTIRHRWNRVRTVIRAGTAVAAAQAAAEADDASLRSFPASATASTAILVDAGMLVTHTYRNTLTPADVADAFAAAKDDDGFTYAPARTTNGWHIPPNGICVALYGTDMHLTHDAFTLAPPTDGKAYAPVGGRDAVMDWLEHLRPLFDSGHVWIGGYQRADGAYEMNATVVFTPAQRTEAVLFAATQNQETAYDIATDEVIKIGGDAGGSLYTGEHQTRLQRLLRRTPTNT